MVSLLFVFLLIACCSLVHTTDDSWNVNISWISSIPEGIASSRTSGKPVAVLISKSGCGACRNLKEVIGKSEEFAEESKHFHMVHIQNSDPGSDYAPDGAYVPRFFILDSDGHVRKEILNDAGNPRYKYYYYDANHMVESMKRARSSPASTTSENGEKSEI